MAKERRSEEEWRQPDLGDRGVLLDQAGLDLSPREAAESQVGTANLAPPELHADAPLPACLEDRQKTQAMVSLL